MNVVLNGDPTELPTGATLIDLLTAAGLDPKRRGVALARNAAVVPRSRWAQQGLADGDIIELLTATQGG